MTRTTNLETLLGHEIATILADSFGGRRLYVPHLSQCSRGGVCRNLPPEIVTLLVFHFGGSKVYIPNRNAPGGIGKLDAKQVQRLTKRGWSASKIAERFHCSERAVHKARKLNAQKHTRNNSIHSRKET